MITDYSDPKVTLNQVYTANTVGTTAVLGVCVLGPHYTVRSYENNGQAVLLVADSSFNAQTGLTQIDCRIAADAQIQMDQKATKVFVKDAQVAYYTSTGTVKVQDSVCTIQNVVFAGKNKTLPIDVAQGDKVKYTTSSGTEETTVAAIVNDGTGIVLNKVISNTQTITKIVLSKVIDAYLDKGSYTATKTAVSILANPMTTVDLGAGNKTYAVVGGNFYAKYRFLNTRFVKRLGVIAATTDAQVEQELGEITPDNPLAMAVACATKAAAGNFVYFTAVNTQTQSAYLEAYDLIADNDGIHGIVPCTSDKLILKAILNQVKLSYNEQIPHFKYLYASVDIPATAQSDLSSAIDTIISDKTVTSERASIVFADGATHNGIQVPNYCVAAAVAGLRSASAPHAPLSNAELPGIDVVNKYGFTASHYKRLGANGFLRVNVNSQGNTVILRQLTSAAADDVNLDEQSIICNIDSICLNIKNAGTTFVGNSNISDELISLLQIDLYSRLDNYKYYTSTLLGPQLLSGQIQSIFQDSVHKDRIYATISGQPPKPFNQFRITFRMI